MVTFVAIPVFSIVLLLLSAIVRKRRWLLINNKKFNFMLNFNCCDRYPDKTFKNCLINNVLVPLRILKLGPYKNVIFTYIFFSVILS